MVSDRLQYKATSAAQGFSESDCHYPIGCSEGAKTTYGALGEIRTTSVTFCYSWNFLFQIPPRDK